MGPEHDFAIAQQTAATSLAKGAKRLCDNRAGTYQAASFLCITRDRKKGARVSLRGQRLLPWILLMNVLPPPRGEIHKASCADRTAVGTVLSDWTFRGGRGIHLSFLSRIRIKISRAQAVTEIFPDSAIAA